MTALKETLRRKAGKARSSLFSEGVRVSILCSTRLSMTWFQMAWEFWPCHLSSRWFKLQHKLNYLNLASSLQGEISLAQWKAECIYSLRLQWCLCSFLWAGKTNHWEREKEATAFPVKPRLRWLWGCGPVSSLLGAWRRWTGGLSSLGLHREIQSKKINKVNFLIT